jgi:Zn finger protein HypA/HybF involved in hydrogenase expression
MSTKEELYKCNTCNWVGSDDECDFDEEGHLVCPLCGDKNLELREK